MRLALVCGALGIPPLAVLVGQALPAPYDSFVAYGPLGIFTLLYILGQVVSKRELDRALARAEKAEAQRDALADRAMSDFVPLVTEVSRTMVPTLDRLVTEVQSVRIDLQRNGERLDRLDHRGRS